MRNKGSFLVIGVLLAAAVSLVDWSMGGKLSGWTYPVSLAPRSFDHDKFDHDRAGRQYAPHKALYKFSMVSAESGAGINGIGGEMFYTQDDACDAWTAEHKMRTIYQYPEKRPVVDTSAFSSWEAKDNSLLHFRSQRNKDGVPVELISGSLRRNADGSATVAYTQPKAMNLTVPKGYVLPDAQTNEIIARARAGEHFYYSVLFDGSTSDGAVLVNTFIGSKITSEEIAAIAAKNKSIDARLLVEGWHVHMAVFPVEEDGSMLPSYEMDMNLHANGVVSDVLIDYKTFKLAQKLVALESLPPKTCP